MAKITKRLVDSLAPSPDKDQFIWDDEVRGFGIRLKPSGSGSFLVQYRTPEGQTRRLVLGKIGTLTPDEARKLAKTKLSAVAGGSDPSAERHAARTALTVGELCDEYLKAAQAGLVLTRFRQPKKASTIAIDVGRIERHIKKLIGQNRADKLTRPMVQRMADDITQGKTAITVNTKKRGKAVVTGGAGTSARVVELLGGIWSWADKRGMVSGANPAHGIDTVRGQAADRVLSKAELKRLGKVLYDQFDHQQQAVRALRLIALTGLRREEAVGLRWSEFDEQNSCLRLNSTKTGPSTRVIGDAAVGVLKRLRSEGERDSEWVFPNRDGSGSRDLKKSFAALFDLAGLNDVRSHDLRRTFASIAAEAEFAESTIAELLGHSRRGVTARHYIIRRPDAVLINAANKISRQIQKDLNAP